MPRLSSVLTALKIESFKAASGDGALRDGAAQGLAVRAREGRKTWYFIYRSPVTGKMRPLRLGPVLFNKHGRLVQGELDRYREEARRLRDLEIGSASCRERV